MYERGDVLSVEGTAALSEDELRTFAGGFPAWAKKLGKIGWVGLAVWVIDGFEDIVDGIMEGIEDVYPSAGR